MVWPVRRSRTNASGLPFVSPGTRFDAAEMNATQWEGCSWSPSRSGPGSKEIPPGVIAACADGASTSTPASTANERRTDTVPVDRRPEAVLEAVGSYSIPRWVYKYADDRPQHRPLPAGGRKRLR